MYKKSPGAAAVLSFFIPGLGHIYNGKIGMGLFLLIGYIIGWATCTFLIGIPILLVIWIVAMVGSYCDAKQINIEIDKKEKHEKQKKEEESEKIETYPSVLKRLNEKYGKNQFCVDAHLQVAFTNKSGEKVKHKVNVEYFSDYNGHFAFWGRETPEQATPSIYFTTPITAAMDLKTGEIIENLDTYFEGLYNQQNGPLSSFFTKYNLDKYKVDSTLQIIHSSPNGEKNKHLIEVEYFQQSGGNVSIKAKNIETPFLGSQIVAVVDKTNNEIIDDIAVYLTQLFESKETPASTPI